MALNEGGKHPHCYWMRKLLLLLSSYNYGGSHRGKIPRSTSSTLLLSLKLYYIRIVSTWILLLLLLSTLIDGHQSIETLSSSLTATTTATTTTAATETETIMMMNINENNNDDDQKMETTTMNNVPNLSIVNENNLLPSETVTTSTSTSTTTTTLMTTNKSNLIVNQSKIIVDSDENNDCFNYEQIVKEYPRDQNCQINIDIDGRRFNKKLPNNNNDDNFTKIISQYEHCHIITGFVSLRHFYFDKNDSLLFNNLVFPNIEYVRDFLLVHNFRSFNEDNDDDDENVNITLGHIFPRLRRIYGYRRIDNIALSISDFWTSDHISFDSLQQVCGTIKVLSSRPYFRHSPTYWHLVDKYRNRRLFTNMTRFQSDYVIPVRSIIDNHNESNFIGIESQLRFDKLISTNKRRIYKILHVSIYEIDPTFYSFVETGIEPLSSSETFFCNTSSRIVILSDLDYSDKQFLFPYHTNSFDQERFPYWKMNDVYYQYRNESHLHPEHFLYNNRIDNIDICRLHNIYYDDNNNNGDNDNDNQSMMITNETYPFQFKHYYVIKLELCIERRHEKCIVHQRYIFNPKFEDFEQILLKFSEKQQQQQQPLDGQWIFSTILIIVIIVIIIMLSIIGLFICCIRYIRPYQLFRLKSFVNMDVVSVNPDYGIVSNHHNDNNNIDQLNHFWSSTTFHYNNNDNNQPLSSSSSSSINNDNIVTCEINRQSLILYQQKMIGKGEFGFVFEGRLLLDHDLNCSYHYLAGKNNNMMEETSTLSSCNCSMIQSSPNNNGNGSNDSIPSIRVAIKQLKDSGFTGNGVTINKEKFIQEAKFMKTFNSNFLVKLLGISTVEEPILVVMEYMEHGDLKRFLRTRYQDYLKCRNNDLLPSFDQLARMAIQIADGMHYLHSKNVIHRDLAARNCMVAADLTVKIGDFGLTRDLYEKDYYRLSEEAPMPLRWMAPESIREMIFTPYSDVWSYGIVLWEIMSFGEQPYRGRSDMEVKQQLLTRNAQLSRPIYYFEPLWEIAQLCCRKRPNRRPNFGEIIEMLYPHLSTNRHQFDNLSYYVSSRMGSYVKYSTFGIMINHCLSFVWNVCLSNKSSSSSSSSLSSRKRKSSMFISSSTSAASTSTSQSTRPLLSNNQDQQQQQQRRDTNSSQQSASTIVDCGCTKLPLTFQKKKSNQLKRLQRQFSTCSSSTTTTTATNNNNMDQMIMMNVVYPSPPPPPPPTAPPSGQSQQPPLSSLITCSSQTSQSSHPPLSNLWNNNHQMSNNPTTFLPITQSSTATIPYGSWIQMNSNNNHSNFFPIIAQQQHHNNNHHHNQQQQQQYSSIESLSNSSNTDVQTEITTLTSGHHHHYHHPHHHHHHPHNQLFHNDYHYQHHHHQYPHQQQYDEQLQMDDDDDCHYEIMSAGVGLDRTVVNTNNSDDDTDTDTDNDDDDDMISKEKNNQESSTTKPLI
ncbi:hypothetical protein DERF_015938 [Dermatophagoides farinae]|uniref:Tyrosine-protein kinase receptor n=1 Tax=Dermatophagoides farinae TaxID=6954 RepID=A0A922HFQ6_DERFA|nr:hypothetical protein DERF_015938 [Dermatophagoides farinae]